MARGEYQVPIPLGKKKIDLHSEEEPKSLTGELLAVSIWCGCRDHTPGHVTKEIHALLEPVPQVITQRPWPGCHMNLLTKTGNLEFTIEKSKDRRCCTRKKTYSTSKTSHVIQIRSPMLLLPIQLPTEVPRKAWVYGPVRPMWEAIMEFKGSWLLEPLEERTSGWQIICLPFSLAHHCSINKSYPKIIGFSFHFQPGGNEALQWMSPLLRNFCELRATPENLQALLCAWAPTESSRYPSYPWIFWAPEASLQPCTGPTMHQPQQSQKEINSSNSPSSPVPNKLQERLLFQMHTYMPSLCQMPAMVHLIHSNHPPGLEQGSYFTDRQTHKIQWS